MFNLINNGFFERQSRIDTYIEYLQQENQTIDTDTSSKRQELDLIDLTSSEEAFIRRCCK